MPAKWLFQLLVVVGGQTCSAPFCLFDPLVQHRLRGTLVRGQRHALLDAVLVAVASPPLLGFAFDSLTGLRVRHPDRLLVQIGHCSSSYTSIIIRKSQISVSS